MCCLSADGEIYGRLSSIAFVLFILLHFMFVIQSSLYCSVFLIFISFIQFLDEKMNNIQVLVINI